MSNFDQASGDMDFNSKLNALKKVAEDVPAMVIINEVKTLTVAYMSERGLKGLNTTLEEIQALGGAYTAKYFNPKDAEDYVPKVMAMMEKGDENEIVSFFQQVRASESDPWKWYFTTVKIFAKDADGNPTHIIALAHPVDPAHHITTKVNRLLEENNFLRANKHIFASLTKREKEILRSMALGESSSAIAEKLYISEDTINTHRRKVRKKLNVSNNYEITQFAQAFDLI
jgi:DNA-binding CsgD family transcriptional regulator